MRVKSLKEVGNNLRDVGECIASQKNQVEVHALTEGLTAFIFRVFGNNGSFDVDGKGLGGYSDAYEKKRLLKGLNNRQKNLVFEGNLRESIQVGINGGKNAMGFTNKDLEQIAIYQEEQLNTDIFSANDEELNIVSDTVQQEVITLIQQCFRRK